MGKELILEIGTEEIPAGFLNDAISALSELTKNELDGGALNYESVSSYGTPRRLTLRVTGLDEKQEDQSTEAYGPPTRIAFDGEGNPTKPAIGFAKAQGVEMGDVITVKRDKGEFLAVRKHIKGQKTDKILKELLPKIILALPFRKSMKWGDGDISFVRPIRWILSIFGGKTVSFDLEGLKSSSKSRGHRFLAPKPFKVTSWEDYSGGLEEGYVLFDQDKRSAFIQDGVIEMARKIGGYIKDDPELVETVTNIVEYPVVLKGDFESEFLELPDEVLISVMKNHQKYFPVFSNSENEKLLPHFIFVSGTPVKDPEVVSKGNGRVIRARFTDARFFYDEDKSEPLERRLEDLKGMVFLSEIGSYYGKVERLIDTAAEIGRHLGYDDKVGDIERAAQLAKADLATQMVFEFPELQGIMGRYYAELGGEKPEVAIAIQEHYMPTSRDGELPESTMGSIVSIADKVDMISACFAAGLIPTGTSDPYALRRQAIGIINIALERDFHLSLSEIFRYSLNLINEQAGGKFADKLDDTLVEIMIFISERFKNITITQGFGQDVADAVISAGFDDIVDTKRKMEALSVFRNDADFESLAIAFKRVVNIVKGQSASEVKENLFVESVENELFDSFTEIREQVGGKAVKKDYAGSLLLMKNLKEPVDRFFESVMVMDKEEKIKENRLSLLFAIRELFFTIADFSKLNT